MSTDPNRGPASPTPAGSAPVNYATASTPKGPAPYSGPAPDQDSKTMGMLAHLLGIFGVVGPLIIWLIKKDKSPFVNDQGKEAVNWHISLICVFVPLIIFERVLILVMVHAVGSTWLALGVSCIFGLIVVAIWICNLIFSIMGGLAANGGKAYRYPFALRLIK